MPIIFDDDEVRARADVMLEKYGLRVSECLTHDSKNNFNVNFCIAKILDRSGLHFRWSLSVGLFADDSWLVILEQKAAAALNSHAPSN